MNTATASVIELLGTNTDNGDLSQSATGTELLKLLGATGSAATSITVDNNDDNVFLVAYDNGNAYLYHLQDQAAAAAVGAVAAEILLVATFEGVAVGGFADNDFIMA